MTHQPDTSNLINVLVSLGMTSYDVTVEQSNRSSSSTHIRVLLDGQVVGTVSPDAAVAIATQLRLLKSRGLERVKLSNIFYL